MKRTILTALALLGLISLQAQNLKLPQSTTYRNQILVSPPYLIENTFMVSYERIFPTKGALRITPSVTLSNVENDIWDEQREGAKIDIGYKAFLIEKGEVVKFNLYLGPYVMYKYLMSSVGIADSEGYSSKEYNIFGAGVDAGIKLTVARFVMDFTLGGGVRYPLDTHGETATSIFSDNYKGIVPRANLSLGIAF